MWTKGRHVGKGAGSKRFSYTPGEVGRPGAKHGTGDDSLSVPQGTVMGRGGCEVELRELIENFGKEPLAGRLKSPTPPIGGVLARQSHFESRPTREIVKGSRTF